MQRQQRAEVQTMPDGVPKAAAEVLLLCGVDNVPKGSNRLL